MLQFQRRLCNAARCVVFNVIYSQWFRIKQHTNNNEQFTWLNEFQRYFLFHGAGNEKFQQPHYKSFKVDMRYNFNYCSQFNLRIINLYIFHFGVCCRVENLNYLVGKFKLNLK